tara:strand:- start:1406 stop:1705 length:300 start_codon:yes stop_codon:yes gene_type:complete
MKNREEHFLNYINDNINSILYRTQKDETILKLYLTMPYQAMNNIFKDENINPMEQCEIVFATAPEWVELVLKNDYSVFDVVHDFTNIAKEEPFFVPRIG